MFVTVVQMCPRYTSDCIPQEHVNCKKDCFRKSLCVICLCGMFFIAPVLNLSSRSLTEQGRYLYFIVVHFESLFSALF